MSILDKLFGRRKRDKKSDPKISGPAATQKTEDGLEELRTILEAKRRIHGSGRDYIDKRTTRFPDRTIEIETYREAARKYKAQGNHPKARAFYSGWVEFLKQQNIDTGGQLESEHEKAKREFSEFVKTDPLYQEIRNTAVAEIQRQPGILQTDLYKALTKYKKSDVMYALYFASDHGKIIRTKKGRTYSLTLPK